MALIDKVEVLGAAVDAGHLDRDEAVHQLQQYSDGGLTLSGARDLLDRWRTARATYADIRMDAELGLAGAEAELRQRNDQED